MEAEALMELFDSYWFKREIFKKQQNLTNFSSSDQNPDRQIEIGAGKLGFNTISRSMSDDLWAKSSFGSGSGFPMSPDSVLMTRKLQTILSGKEITDEEGEIGNSTNSIQIPIQNFIQDGSKKRGKIRKKKKLSKSLSELEFEEVKGFMDLGFVFSEEDKDDSSLVSIIPGLQRLGKKEPESEIEKVARPYLSEAWEALDKEKKQEPLMNWRIPAVSNEIDMKDNLKSWAKTIASAVR